MSKVLWCSILGVIQSCGIVCLGWQQYPSISRRNALIAASSVTMGAFAPPLENAQAARGAAELDFEYYMRDLLGGNKKEGNVLPSAAPDVPPPRILQQPLLNALLNDDFSPSCIPVQTLVQTVEQRTGRKRADIVAEIQEKADSLRDKASRSFYTRAPWQTPTVSDQYYMDLSAYALWRTAADLLPNFVDRDVFVRNMGRALYQTMLSSSQEGWIDATSVTKSGSIVATMDRVQQVLQVFQKCNYCKDFKLGPDEPLVNSNNNNSKKKNGKANQEVSSPTPSVTMVVDELDDEALANGGTVDVLVRILEPATLGAALQITGEQSRFAPDYIGPTLAALWEESAGLTATWESYFVDPVYRVRNLILLQSWTSQTTVHGNGNTLPSHKISLPLTYYPFTYFTQPNPKDYFPTEKLLQFTLKLK